jgi:glucose/arabinose dehydrogenase
MVNRASLLLFFRRMLRPAMLVAVVLCGMPVSGAGARALPLDQIKLPDGFRIDVYAEGLSGARSMARGPKGTIFVGSRNNGQVRAVIDHDGDQRADEVVVIAQGLAMPNGVAMRGGALYVAEVGRVLRFDDIEDHLYAPPVAAVVRNDLPREAHHGWRYIGFGPDDRLYISVGAPCNICDEPLPFASIISMRADGTDPQVYARGIRNSVGFAWHPDNGDLWFTDNGRDHLGDHAPPDELNHASGPGQHFGYPYCHGGNIADPEFGDRADCDEFRPPAARLGAHVASLGMQFYAGDMFPPRYRGNIFIAEHGSWNRSEKAGYRISLVRLDGNRAVQYETFAEGWLQDDDAWGRPVDLLVLPDGSLLVSDDAAGAIYRISYRE